ncbi:MAG TPA: BlaI/MecI/CopY family transcriptional regulator [Chthonomonadaceae bacterium]|nr:BlaI/MecI/CopY family transcriptional regulator [Chthonomonadaceae bacterium]
MRKPTVGNQEMEVLRFVAEHAPISTGEVARQYGEPHGLARGTIIKMMERLEKKGYLTRQQVEGVYQYMPSVPKQELWQNLMRDFVEKTFKGSVSPIVAYLTHTRQVSEEDLEELGKLVDEMRANKEREQP